MAPYGWGLTKEAYEPALYFFGISKAMRTIVVGVKVAEKDLHVYESEMIDINCRAPSYT